MSTALVLHRLRARRDAWSLFAWLCVGAALMLAAMPGDLESIHALRTLIATIALLAVAGAVLLALGVLRRERCTRDSLMALAALTAGVLVYATVLA